MIYQNKFLGSKNLLCAQGRAGQAQHLFSWRRISQSEIRNSAAAEARAGREFIFPTPLFLPAPPERSVWRAKRAVSSVQKRFGFRQTNAPQSNFQKFCQRIQPRETRQRTETLARRAWRGSPSAGSKSLAILSICFTQLKTNNINL
jgi:hypothetical protein